MEKFELSSEQYDYEAQDSVISFDVETSTRKLLVNVQPFHGFVVMEEGTGQFGLSAICYHKFFTHDIQEWNEYYERLIKTAGKSYAIKIKEPIKRAFADRKNIRKHKN